uniref:E3 ubiquitin-protein ligase E3D n=1 Tax=Nannospalax galili TaxID=1026970 RepID=A0A8C6QXF9_NANGA
KLLRVLPLPTENWGALVGEWCCHPDPFANKPLHPRENDCFIGDSFFLVNLRSNLGQEPKANTKVICKRCKVLLGETISSETTKFYMTEIIIQLSERNFPIIPRSQFIQSVIAQCLVELSSARSTFRFTIQGQDGKVYILLASSWESDISIHALTLPSATCLELLLILSRSNASLPQSLRQMNSFQVAFLKM